MYIFSVNSPSFSNKHRDMKYTTVCVTESFTEQWAAETVLSNNQPA